MSTPKISVIVPVYNASRYLDACIGSLLKQSFGDFELLLVNDGSKDDSLAICRSYAEQDCRVRVLDKPNGGVSSARNAGLDNAVGQWIAFVDSDDTATPGYLAGLHEARSRVPEATATLVAAGFDAVDVDSGATLYTQTYPDHVYDKDAICKGFMDNQLVRFGMPWSKLYDRQLIESLGLRFDPQLSFSEDLVFMLSYLRHAQNLVTSSRCDYLYARNTNGLSTAYSDFDKEYRFLCAMKDGVEAINGGNCDTPLWIRHHGSMSLRVLSCLYRPKTKRSRKERLAALERFAADHAREIGLSTNRRIRLLCGHHYLLFDALTSAMFHLRFSALRHLWPFWLRLKSRLQWRK